MYKPSSNWFTVDPCIMCLDIIEIHKQVKKYFGFLKMYRKMDKLSMNNNNTVLKIV